MEATNYEKRLLDDAVKMMPNIFNTIKLGAYARKIGVDSDKIAHGLCQKYLNTRDDILHIKGKKYMKISNNINDNRTEVEYDIDASIRTLKHLGYKIFRPNEITYTEV